MNERRRPLPARIAAAESLEIRALARCRSCGKTRELAGDELHGAADMDAFKELERRLRCSDCGERAVSVEPIFHPDWRG
jgi:rubredoxin